MCFKALQGTHGALSALARGHKNAVWGLLDSYHKVQHNGWAAYRVFSCGSLGICQSFACSIYVHIGTVELLILFQQLQ